MYVVMSSKINYRLFNHFTYSEFAILMCIICTLKMPGKTACNYNIL